MHAQRSAALQPVHACWHAYQQLLPMEAVEDVLAEVQAGTQPLAAAVGRAARQRASAAIIAGDVCRGLAALGVASAGATAAVRLAKHTLCAVATPVRLRGPMRRLTGLLLPQATSTLAACCLLVAAGQASLATRAARRNTSVSGQRAASASAAAPAPAAPAAAAATSVPVHLDSAETSRSIAAAAEAAVGSGTVTGAAATAECSPGPVMPEPAALRAAGSSGGSTWSQDSCPHTSSSAAAVAAGEAAVSLGSAGSSSSTAAGGSGCCSSSEPRPPAAGAVLHRVQTRTPDAAGGPSHTSNISSACTAAPWSPTQLRPTNSAAAAAIAAAAAAADAGAEEGAVAARPVEHQHQQRVWRVSADGALGGSSPTPAAAASSPRTSLEGQAAGVYRRWSVGLHGDRLAAEMQQAQAMQQQLYRPPVLVQSGGGHGGCRITAAAAAARSRPAQQPELRRHHSIDVSSTEAARRRQQQSPGACSSGEAAAAPTLLHSALSDPTPAHLEQTGHVPGACGRRSMS